MLADDVCDDADKRRRYKRIDEAEATGFVGKGGYGQVFIAEDTLTGGVVAVKRQKYPSTDSGDIMSMADWERRQQQWCQWCSQNCHHNDDDG